MTNFKMTVLAKHLRHVFFWLGVWMRIKIKYPSLGWKQLVLIQKKERLTISPIWILQNICYEIVNTRGCGCRLNSQKVVYNREIRTYSVISVINYALLVRKAQQVYRIVDFFQYGLWWKDIAHQILPPLGHW